MRKSTKLLLPNLKTCWFDSDCYFYNTYFSQKLINLLLFRDQVEPVCQVRTANIVPYFTGELNLGKVDHVSSFENHFHYNNGLGFPQLHLFNTLFNVQQYRNIQWLSIKLCSEILGCRKESAVTFCSVLLLYLRIHSSKQSSSSIYVYLFPLRFLLVPELFVNKRQSTEEVTQLYFLVADVTEIIKR